MVPVALKAPSTTGLSRLDGPRSRRSRDQPSKTAAVKLRIRPILPTTVSKGVYYPLARTAADTLVRWRRTQVRASLMSSSFPATRGLPRPSSSAGRISYVRPASRTTSTEQRA